MKNFRNSLCIFFALAVFFASPALAGNMGESGRGGHGGGGGGSDSHGERIGGESSEMPGDGHGTNDHGMDSSNQGRMIHASNVDGFKLSYELIDMGERMKDMPNMPEMAATHHLMVYVEGPGGFSSENAKAGYLIVGPDGEKQTVMGVEMTGGFGADVKLAEKGVYTIKTKIATENDSVMDSFTHEID